MRFPLLKIVMSIPAMAGITLISYSMDNSTSYRTDRLTTRDGSSLSVMFFGHASLAFEFDGRYIYVDPVGQFADYGRLPKADVILITHDHYDHLDPEAVETLEKEGTLIVGNRSSVEKLGKGRAMDNGDTLDVDDRFRIDAVPAYNTTPGHEQFHPRGGRDNGYLLTVGDSRIYVAGDTELIPEMRSLGRVDIAFLPVNQPYTMTVDEAAEAVRTIRPGIFYPYHFGQTDTPTDTERLAEILRAEGFDVRIRDME